MHTLVQLQTFRQMQKINLHRQNNLTISPTDKATKGLKLGTENILFLPKLSHQFSHVQSQNEDWYMHPIRHVKPAIRAAGNAL